MSDASSSRILVAAAVIWIAFAFAYPLFWRQASPNLGTLRADQRGGVLKLPDEGPLSLIVAKGSVVTLAVERAKPATVQSAPGTAPAVQVQSPATPLPSSYDLIPDVPVMDTTCLSDSPRRSNCYAVVAVSVKQIETVMGAGRVWVWLQKQ